MNNNKDSAGSAFVLGVLLCVGLALLGYFVSGGIVRIRALDRTVEVKGLSEREVPADIAIWPIRFNEADNDLNLLFLTLERKQRRRFRTGRPRGIRIPRSSFDIRAPRP